MEKEKRAIIMLNEPNNFVGPEEEMPNVERWYCDGIAYDIAYGKPVAVPLSLAKQMLTAGKIKVYTEI